MAPASDMALRETLATLRLRTVSRKAGDKVETLTLEIYLRDLKAYAGDIVLDVVEKWPNKFFPAWSEIKEAITSDPRSIKRARRIRALKSFLENGAEPEPTPQSPEEKAKITTGFQKLKAELGGVA